MPTRKAAFAGPLDAVRETLLSGLPRSAVGMVDQEMRIVLLEGGAIQPRPAPDHFVGRRLDQAFGQTDYEAFGPRVRAALDGVPQSFELLAASGAWYQIDVLPVFEDGEVVAAAGYAIDISPQKTAEAREASGRAFLQEVLDSIGYPVMVKDEDLRLTLVNRAFELASGIDRDQASGRTLADLLPPELSREYMESDRHVIGTGETVSAEREFSRADGTVRSYLTESAPLRAVGGRVIGVVTVSADITARRVAQERLQEVTRLFEMAFANAPIGMALIGLDGSFRRANHAFSQLTGYPLPEITSMTVEDITYPPDQAEDASLRRRLLGGEIDHFQFEKRYVRKDGELAWVDLSVSLIRNETGQPIHLIAQVMDIADRRRVEADLRREAGEDVLTGLANRRQFEAALRAEIERCRRYDGHAALLMVDIDRFKSINDRFGHATGDRVLRWVATELKGNVRSTDLTARLGGDEFVLILPGADGDLTRRIAGQIGEHFDKVRFDPEGLSLKVPLSVGSTAIGPGSGSAEQALREADEDMYRRKRERKEAS